MKLTRSRLGLVLTCVVLAGTASTVALALVRGAAGAPFVTVCGRSLCLEGAEWAVHGATAYQQYGDTAGTIAMARSGRLDALELVEFDHVPHVLSDTEAPDTWTTADRFIAAASAAHLHVILNLSEYGQSLQAAGYTMSSSRTGSWPHLGWQGDWDQYLRFVANRVNTVSHLRYKDDPTIAMVEIWGEIPAPNEADPVGTTVQMRSFYARTLARWRSLAPRILVSTGGFSHLNDSHGGIPWRSIMANRSNATCDIEINSSGDRDITVEKVTRYCRRLGKPWFLAAWSSCSEPSGREQDLDHWLAATPPATDIAMAAHALEMYAIAHGAGPAAYPAIGSDFWNLGPATSDTCDLGPASPESPSRTWAVVQAAH
jgi:hypothetical protein